MTIKELFDQITFEELYPHLRVLVQEYRKCFIEETYLFREAYDRLKLTKPHIGESKQWRSFSMMK